MILAGDFYSIENNTAEADKITATLKINAGHQIFQGHFPGQPVVPGVCMMQMIKELLETVTNRPLRLQTGLDLKFLSIIDPEKNNIVYAEISYTVLASDDINTTARLFFNETTFFKFKGVYTS